MKQQLIKLSEIETPERYRTDYGDIESLKASIREHGLIQPIAVSITGSGFRLLAGGRRLRACTELQLDTIPARIYERDLGELDSKAIELAENVDRKDFDWKERIRLEQKIHELQVAIHGEKTSKQPDATGWSMRDTATLLGRSIGAVSGDITLAKALETIPELAACKTKDDAGKMLRLLQEQMIKSELASRFEEEKAETADEIKKRNLINCYLVKDVFDGLAGVQSGTIQYIDCDPPYGINLDHRFRGFESGRVSHNPSDYHEVEKSDFPLFLETLLAECYRVMTPNSWMTLWFGVDPWADLTVELLRKVGFKVNRLYAIWHKAKPPYHSSQPHTNLASAYDAFYYCRKGDAVLFKQGQSNVFLYPQVPTKVHPTEKPIDLMTHIISIFTLPGATCLVPFLGSGNSLLAATNLGCSGAGFDLSENYKNDFKLKVLAQPFASYTSY